MALTLWFHHRYEKRGRRPGRAYTLHDGAGALCFTGWASRVPGPMELFAAGDPASPWLRGRPRRSFPLTGRYDVVLGQGDRVGVITRSGRFFTPDGGRAGRFRDARSMKRHLGEGVAVAVLEGLLGAGDASAGEGVGASAFVLQLEGRAPGRLVRQRLPFMPPHLAVPPEPGRAGRLLRRVLPDAAADRLLERKPPSGWLLEVPDTGATPEPLLVAAALLTIEVVLW